MAVVTLSKYNAALPVLPRCVLTALTCTNWSYFAHMQMYTLQNSFHPASYLKDAKVLSVLVPVVLVVPVLLVELVLLVIQSVLVH